MKRKILFSILVVFVALAVLAPVVLAKGFGKPLTCIAASTYADGTIIYHPCPSAVQVDGVDGLRMVLPQPGKFYRPGVRP